MVATAQVAPRSMGAPVAAPARAQVEPFKHNLTEQKIAEMREAFSLFDKVSTLKSTYTSNEGSVIEPHVDHRCGGVSELTARLLAGSILIIVHMSAGRRWACDAQRADGRSEVTRPETFRRGSDRTCKL